VTVIRIAVALLIACSTAISAPRQYDVLVQGALDWEIQPLLAALQNKHEEHIAAWTFWTGRIGRKWVVVSRTDMGPINAAAATVLGIEHFHPKVVINQGTAGGHDPALHVYDIVVGEKTIDYSAYKTESAGAGQGSKQERWTPMYHKVGGTQYRGFPGDAQLMAAALATPYDKGKVVKGTVGSGFEFNREIDHIAWVHKTYGTDSEDMESAYVAGVAVGMKVPFLAVRILSDTEYGHPHLERAAGQYCAEFVVQMIRRMGEKTSKLP
jgi:adenosylhomocysteine nucleosidase